MASQLNASSSASETPSRVSFTPSSGLVRISPNLFMLSDTCNVYLLRDGDRGLLIDFG